MPRADRAARRDRRPPARAPARPFHVWMFFASSRAPSSPPRPRSRASPGRRACRRRPAAAAATAASEANDARERAGPQAQERRASRRARAARTARTVSTAKNAASPSTTSRLSSSGSRSYWNVAMSVQRVALHRSQLHTQFILPRSWNQPDTHHRRQPDRVRGVATARHGVHRRDERRPHQERRHQQQAPHQRERHQGRAAPCPGSRAGSRSRAGTPARSPAPSRCWRAPCPRASRRCAAAWSRRSRRSPVPRSRCSDSVV